MHHPRARPDLGAWRDAWHGYFIACADASIGDDNLPGSLEAVLTWGRESGFEWIRIDIDGPRVAGLPTYE